MKNFRLLIITLLVFFAGCSKEEVGIINESLKFKIQTDIFVHRQEKNIKYISFSDLNDNNIKIHISSGIFQDEYVLIKEKTSMSGTFTAEKIKTNVGDIFLKVSGTDYKNGNTHINSQNIYEIELNGEKFEKYTVPFGNAQPGNIGRSINNMIIRDRVCSFVACVNNMQETVTWTLLDDNTISIKSESININGLVINSDIATPIIKSNNGNTYIICFYSNFSDGLCACEGTFNIYQIKSNEVKPIIGDCNSTK